MPSSSPQPARSWLIGSSPECDIVVNHPTVSGKHCRLTCHENGYLIEDLNSTNGTFVGSRRLNPLTPFGISAMQPVVLANGIPMPWPAEARPATASSPGSSPGPVPASVPGARTITLGRATDCDVCLDYPIVSAHHARIIEQGGQYFIEDLNSRNGTSLNKISNRIQRAPLRPTDDIFLGSYKISAATILEKRHVVVGEAAYTRVDLKSDSMVVGRDPACDQPVDHPTVSWHHARITRMQTGMYVEDLGSLNGTFLGATPVTGRVLAHLGQEISIGNVRFQIMEGGVLARREYTGNVSIEAHEVVVLAPDGKRLLDPVSLVAYPSELIAMMGPAGAGKTTLLKSLNGYSRPNSGQVLFNGLDLYRNYDRFCQQLAYVPQDDIVHPQLTVREALYFSAKLRTDLSDTEIDQRIDKLLSQLNLSDKKNTIIGSPENKVLSGGQRKRVNIAMELITDTPVLFLDEPTSGLSSYDAEGVVHLLKELARQGKTIIATIHQPSLKVFKEFDNLIMLARDSGGSGALAFFGPAYPDSIEFLHPREPETTQPVSTGAPAAPEPGPELLLTGLAKSSASQWSTKFRDSRYRKQFIEDRTGKAAPSAQDANAKRARRFNFTQFFTLIRRNAIVKLRNTSQMLILGMQAPLIAALIVLVYGRVVSSAASFQQFQEMSANIIGIHILMVVAAIWFGCNNAARDIVGEWAVFYRERMVNLKLPSYVFSKFALLLAFSVLQCFVMLGIVYFASDLRAEFWKVALVLVLASAVGTCLGLSISARSSSTESAIALLPIVLLPVIVLGGGLKQIYRMPKPMQWVSTIIPSRWAFEYNVADEARHRNTCVEIPGPCHPDTPAGTGGAPHGATPSTASVPGHPGARPVGDPLPAAPVWTVDAADFQVPVTIENSVRAKPDVAHSQRLTFPRTLGILGAMIVVLLTSVFVFLRSRVPH